MKSKLGRILAVVSIAALGVACSVFGDDEGSGGGSGQVKLVESQSAGPDKGCTVAGRDATNGDTGNRSEQAPVTKNLWGRMPP